jgi:hypothetical protein
MAGDSTTTDDTSATDTTTTDTATTTDDATDLGDSGKKALDAERTAKRAAEKRAKDAELELEKLRKAAMSEQDLAVATARDEARTETAGKYQSRIISAEIRAAAGGKLADPSDAVRLLDLSEFNLDDNDEVDSAAVAKAIDELLKSKPYLGVKDDRRFQGGADQGARGGQKQTIDDQIREAEGKGDWRTAGALKAQKLSELPHS